MESLFLLPPPLFWGEESIREFLRSVDEANFLLEDYFPKGHGLHNRESLIDSIGRFTWPVKVSRISFSLDLLAGNEAKRRFNNKQVF